MKNILQLNNLEARKYLLKEESYFNFDLPKYFSFKEIIKSVSAHLKGHKYSEFLATFKDANGKNKSLYPSDCESVNYIFLNNKDGKFSWRPFQLIHPVLYVSLAYEITEKNNWNIIKDRFIQFELNSKIKCYSLPMVSDGIQSDKAVTVTHWWQAIEQQSIELALSYEYVLHTDISDCYGSIYTHSVPWAVHTKPFAKHKDNKNDQSLIGNIIDKHLREMSFGQTNGIPQGSVLMDFIAEMVLGYADIELSNKIKNHSEVVDYHIIRYRDDYRIFSNNPQVGELILKLLTEVLISLGMKLNAQKTIVSTNVVRDSIKGDKIFWLIQKNGSKSISKHLLLIHNLSMVFPNSGSLNKALGKFYVRIIKTSKATNVPVLISILVDIMYKNPRTYSIAVAVLSKLFVLLDDVEMQEKIVEKIIAKFKKIPNTGHIEVWLQRLTIKVDETIEYSQPLCKIAYSESVEIWNSNWLNAKFKKIINDTKLIDKSILENIEQVIQASEVQLFKSEYDGYS